LSLRWDMGPKWDKTDLIALVFLWFSYSYCVLAHSYKANGGTDMEVLACFRPGFLVQPIILLLHIIC